MATSYTKGFDEVATFSLKNAHSSFGPWVLATHRGIIQIEGQVTHWPGQWPIHVLG